MGCLMKRISILVVLGFIILFWQSFAHADNGKTITITDMSGRKLNIPAKVNRVVPLGGALRFLTYMRAVDKVVGIEAYEKKNKNSPGRTYSLAIADIVDSIQTIGEGGPGRLPDFEKVIAVKPDVIITMGLDISLVETIQQKTAMPVIVLSYGGMGELDFDMVFESIKTLGKLLGKEKRADYLVSYINNIRSDLQKKDCFNKEKAICICRRCIF